MESKFCIAFKASCCYRISESRRMLAKALQKVSETTLWERPNVHSNSLGNQLLHMEGNLRQYVVAALGGVTDTRTREREFAVKGGTTLEVLWNTLENTMMEAIATLQNCDEETLVRNHSVQGFSLSGVDVAIHAVEHLSYHTGQIAFWIKQLTNSPLGFYDGLDLDSLNSNKC